MCGNFHWFECAEAGIGTWAVVEKKPGMRGVSNNRRSICIALAKQAKPELTDVLNSAFQSIGELVLNTEIDRAHFRITLDWPR